jgi:hypothetical protein
VFGNSHHISVRLAQGGRKYEYVCSCGATGWQTESAHRAEQMGREHKAKASKKGQR